jgi:hypothetical protein
MAWVVKATPLTIPRYGAACGVFSVWNRTLSVLLILLLRYTLSVLLMVTVHFISVPCMLGLMYLVPHILCVPCLLYVLWALRLCPVCWSCWVCCINPACCTRRFFRMSCMLYVSRMLPVFYMLYVSCMLRVPHMLPLCSILYMPLTWHLPHILLVPRMLFVPHMVHVHRMLHVPRIFIPTNFNWKLLSSHMVISAPFNILEWANT